jgi:hypothetical protein
MLKKRAKTSLQYWQVDGAEFPAIRAVALNVFSMVTSSAASERGFSTMGFVRSKMRNRLGSERSSSWSSSRRMPHSYSLIRQALNEKNPRKVMVMKTVGRLLNNESCTMTAKASLY